MKNRIDETLIDHLANLAKLNFDASSKAAIKDDLNRILTFIDQLDKVDVSEVEPLIHVTDETGDARKDEANNPISQSQALSNAPDRDSDYFKVPKVMR